MATMSHRRPRGEGASRGRSSSRSGVHARSLRAMNLSLILRRILAAPGDITRAGLAQATGITPATVSRLVDELIGAGLVAEVAPSSDVTRGRPANRLVPAPNRALGLGLELNVTSIDAALIDLDGRMVASAHVDGDFVDSDPAASMRMVADAAHALVAEHLPEGASLIGTGLALPGLVSPEALAFAPNLGWRDIPLGELLEPLADLAPRVVANEADLGAYAVARPRPGVPCGPESFVFVTGEVGIGSGIVNGHELLSGAHGWSGEIGHICVDPNGPRCSCGATGCLEAYVGLRALASRVGLGSSAGTAQIRAAAEARAEARAAVGQAGAALGRALAAIINAVDIPLVLLGGSVAELSDLLIDPLVEEISARVLQAGWSHPSIEVIDDSYHLSVRGAAHKAMQSLVDDPISWTSPEDGD